MSQKDDRDLDAPVPPGGPLRRDGASVDPEDSEASAHEDARTFGEPPGEHTDDLPDSATPSAAEESLQEENAETSLDQPSS